MIVTIIFIVVAVLLFAMYIIIFDQFEGNPYWISCAVVSLSLSAMALGCIIEDLSRTHIVIEKSKDSNWIYSANQSIERDTTITTPKLFIKGTDTIVTLPTIEYKVIKIK